MAIGNKLRTAAFLVATVLAAPAAAMTTFTFGAGTNTVNTIAMTEDGLTLTTRGFINFDASAFMSSGALGTPQNINNFSGNGWGVNNGGSGGLLGPGDALNLAFTPESVVLLSAVTFELDGAADQFTLYNGQSAVGTFNLPADPAADVHTFTGLDALLGAGAIGDNFTIATTAGGIRLQELTVDRVSAVPLPPAALLMGGVILAFAGGARLRRR